MTAKPVTHARVLRIAWPIALSNATVPILGAVDTGVVGQLGQAAPIGAVGIGAIIIGGLYWIFGFLRMGTTGLTGQALGAGDAPEVSALLSRAMMLAMAAGVLLIAGQIWLFNAAFAISPASPEVEGLARHYMSIRIWSSPAAIAVYGLTGWLIAQERTRAVLVIQLWMNGVNIVLDLLFVLGLDWGVGGVATATVIAETSGAALGLWLCRDGFNTPAWRDWPRVFDRARLIHMARVNRDIMIRSMLLQAIFISFLFLGSDFGDVPLAANQILLQFLYITAYALDGFAFAVEALVGQALGAHARETLRRAAKLCLIWTMSTSAVLALIFAVAGGLIIDLMTTAPLVREAARAYLPYMIAAPLLGAPSWLLDGIFIGATRSTDMRNMMALSFVIYVIAAALLIPPLGNHGLWIAFLISFVARGLTLGSRYPALERLAD
ncbi:MATE family efflux transporter [Actibacterium sp. XHP0104]|uniref:MATE family efflux transporter n=1 Tax=Actibacterium sp. XHP0104 TaxID=2984335 RepID=UPI0021E76201|nr:MATE family efflux transporter [Actibacterium sp. XHP0104]MCV2882891.1 MATE family efflux transporter [Actibacterium sp. XHP0104]